MNGRARIAVLALIGCGCLAAAHADERRPPGAGHHGHAPARTERRAIGVPARVFDGRGRWLDDRYHHGRYYPRVGRFYPELPPGYRPYYYRGSRYYFHGGAWYAPRAAGFVVVRPPAGLVVSILPPFYTTVWIGGFPYYYADDVYYTWRPSLNGYVVVDPPAGADAPAPPPPRATNDELIIYPKDGQSADQQAADRYDCHRWAKDQTGFDPTLPGGGVAPPANARSRADYHRAMTACLEARGYEVK